MSSFRVASIALALFLITGCSTLESAAEHARTFARQHPVVTGVAVAVIVGGTVAALDHHHPQRVE